MFQNSLVTQNHQVLCAVVHIPKQGDCRHFLALIIFQSSHPSDQTRIAFGMTKRVNEITCKFCFAKLPNKQNKTRKTFLLMLTQLQQFDVVSST